MKIVVLDGFTLNPGDNPWDGLAGLGDLEVHDRTPRAEILPRAAKADILLTNKTPLSREIIETLPQLKFIAVLATGYNVVDGSAARERGIPVSNVPTYGTDSVAQHTMALILELCHRVGWHDASVRQEEWSEAPDFCYWNSPLIELTGKTLGLIGYGRIGRKVAELARAFGMEIVYRQRDGSARTETGAQGMPLDELTASADVISLHCALTPENTRFVNRAFLSTMKPTAFLINTSRGALIDEPALAEALQAGTIAGAALDVLTQEPPPAKHPLFSTPNCLITPHMAWTSLKARKSLMQTTVENVRAFLAGQPANVVNP